MFHESFSDLVEGFGGRGGGGGGGNRWNNDDSRSHYRDGNRDRYGPKDDDYSGPPMASRGGPGGGGRGGYQSNDRWRNGGNGDMGAPPPQQFNTRWQEPPPGGNDRWDRTERSKFNFITSFETLYFSGHHMTTRIMKLYLHLIRAFHDLISKAEIRVIAS